MGLFDSLFGSKSTTTQSGTSTTASEMEQLATLIESALNQSSSSTTRGGAREDTGLNDLQALLKTYMVDPIATARNTSKAAVDSAITNVLNRGLPGINTARTTAGGYNDSTTAILQDNLTVEAARAGAEVEQKAITDFASLQQSAVQNLIAAIQTGLEQRVVTDVEEEQTRTGTESTSSTASENTASTGTGTSRDRDSLVGGLSKAVSAFTGGNGL